MNRKIIILVLFLVACAAAFSIFSGQSREESKSIVNRNDSSKSDETSKIADAMEAHEVEALPQVSVKPAPSSRLVAENASFVDKLISSSTPEERVQSSLSSSSATTEPASLNPVEASPIPATTTVETTPVRVDPEFWIWGGIGENYQYYQQSIPSLSGSAKFQNIQGPTWSVIAGAQGQNFGVEISHKETPGFMEGPAETKTVNGNYVWKTMAAEGLYKPDGSSWRFRGGLQHHLMPFMTYTPSTKVLEIKSNTLVVATIGFDRYFPISKKLRAEWQMHYQHPILSGTNSSDEFSVNSVFAFDGSLGVSYKVDEKFRLGLYWYGQYHNYKFDYAAASSFSGDQTLMYSNAELRAGWEF